MTALLQEAVLYCQVGTPETMERQLADLLEMSKRRNVILQILRGNEVISKKVDRATGL